MDEMHELRGVVTIPKEQRSLTCCESVDDILVGGKSVGSFLSSLLPDCPSEDDPTGTFVPEQHVYRMRYVVSPDTITLDDFDTAAAQVTLNTELLMPKWIRGCYSDATCGTGDYEFKCILNAHPLAVELASYVGQYAWVRFTKSR